MCFGLSPLMVYAELRHSQSNEDTSCAITWLAFDFLHFTSVTLVFIILSFWALCDLCIMHIARSSMDTKIAVKFQQLYLNCCGHVRHLCVSTMPFWFKQWPVVLLGVRLTYEAMLTYWLLHSRKEIYNVVFKIATICSRIQCVELRASSCYSRTTAYR